MKSITYIAFCIFIISTVLLTFSLQDHEWSLVVTYSIGSILATLLIYINNKLYNDKENRTKTN